MPHFTRLCEVLDSQRTLLDASGPVGRITRLRLADIELVADQTGEILSCPVSGAPAVAVLRQIDWGLGASDVVALAGLVSVSNRQEIARLILDGADSIEVTFRVVVHERDPDTTAWQPVFQSEQDMRGVIERADDALSIADEAVSESDSPGRYPFEIRITPRSDVTQTFLVSGPASRRFAKPWGAAD